MFTKVVNCRPGRGSCVSGCAEEYTDGDHHLVVDDL